jgi:hypothetical protein
VTISGARTWFNSQSTILIGGTVYAGAVTSAGDVVVGPVGGSATTLHATFQTDDHDNPALLRRSSDGRIIAAYCRHAVDNNYYVRISTNPDDLSAFDAEENIGVQLGNDSDTYANLVEVTDGIFNFFRAVPPSGRRAPHYSISSDGGVTWATDVHLLSNGTQRPYIHVANGGSNRIDIVCNSGNPVEILSGECSLYHLYYDAGSWKKSDGTVITNPPFDTATELTRIWDGSTIKAWSWDIRNYDGVPIIVYAVFPSLTDHRYRYARWTGSSWDDHEICDAGGTIYPSAGSQDYYSGGVCLDPDNKNRIFCSRKIGSVHQIFKGVTSDDGATWTLTQLTSSASKCFRPQKLGGTNTITYVTGTYTSYTNYSTAIEWLEVSPEETAVSPEETAVAITHTGSRIVPQGRHISRQRWREIMEAIAAQRAVEERAERLKSRPAKKALTKAAQEAALAIASAKESEASTARLTAALEAAKGASSLAETIHQSELAIQYAQQIMDEEEEAVALLLLH